MNAPAVSLEGRLQSIARTGAPGEKDLFRHLSYVVIAVVAFIAGMLFAGLAQPAQGGSRIAWPPAESIKPHPRSIQP